MVVTDLMTASIVTTERRLARAHCHARDSRGRFTGHVKDIRSTWLILSYDLLEHH